MNYPEQKKYTPKPMFKNPKRAFNIFMGCGILFIILLNIFIIIPLSKKQSTERFIDFDSTNIIGIISKIKHVPKCCSSFSVNNEKKTYYVFDCPQFESNRDNSLSGFASIGDSIIKLRFSDTLYLMKDGKRFEYTFDQFDPNNL